MSVLRYAVLFLTVAFALPAAAQKTTQGQPMAGPGESTEPPPPHAAPVGVVQAQTLPRGGGILVFGGTHGTGLETVKVLAARKEHVTVVTHSDPHNPELAALGVTVVAGNALDPATIKDIFTAAPFRAVVTTIGRSPGEADPSFTGNKNIIDAAKAASIPRLIMVSTIGAGDSVDQLAWIEQIFYRKTFALKTDAENYLKASGLNYTIMRPGGLVDKSADGKAVFTTDQVGMSWISRADLGKLIADCVDNDADVNKTFTVFDPSRAGLLGWFRS
jgi:uncharacterized protein YbjT (DUF2867 family)